MNNKRDNPATPPLTLASTEATDRVTLPPQCNYIAAFLTFRCPYHCEYCINHFDQKARNRSEVNAETWIKFFERLPQDNDIPITLQGGEPGLHPDFLNIINHAVRLHKVDILTNLAFDLDEFIGKIDPETLSRDAPYAPIRCSYHPSQFSLFDIIRRIQRLTDAGFRVGLYAVEHPDITNEIDEARQLCKKLHIDFRTKPFLGWHNGSLHGEFAYPEACRGETRETRDCVSSEVLIAPDAKIHRCHHNLYHNLKPLAHITDPQINLDTGHQPCHEFGHCNPCDIKIKNNRYQQFGHVSVNIRPQLRTCNTNPANT